MCFTLKHRPIYLENSGTVLKGIRVADIIDKADDVTGHFIIRQVVKVREDFMKLVRTQRRFVLFFSQKVAIHEKNNDYLFFYFIHQVAILPD